MRLGLVSIAIILDRSGSMASVKEGTIAGFNEFVESQKKLPGEATISLFQFDDVYETVYDGIDIKNTILLTEATYQPRNITALLDAIGKTIINLGQKLNTIPEKDRPEKVIVVIQTDGYENASKEFSSLEINEMITHQREKYNWQFVFLGANQDAIMTASHLGIAANKSMTYAHSSDGNIHAMGISTNRLVSSLRSASTADMDGVGYSDLHKKQQEDLINQV